MSALPGSFAKGEKGKSGKYAGININWLYKGKTIETQEKKTIQKHGLQSLGKVCNVRRMPPPPNLPSLKSENSGNDPNVNLVPTGASGWGNKETPGGPQGAPPQQQPPQPPPAPKGPDSGSSSGAGPTPMPTTPSPAVDVVTKPSSESAGPPLPPPTKAVPVPPPQAAPSSSSTVTVGSGERSWSSVTSKVSERAPGFLKHESDSFQREFPELAGEGDQKQQPSDASYGPVPSLRPQTEGSWIQGGGRNVPQPPNTQVPQAKLISGSPSPSDSGAGSMVPQGGVPVPEGHPAPPPPPLGPGPMSMPRMHGPAGHPPPHQFRSMMPPFLMNTYQNAYPPPNYPQRMPPPPRNPFQFDPAYRPNVRPYNEEEGGYAPRPIVKEEDLKSFDDVSDDRDNWASSQGEIDYNKKINFSDDEEEKDDENKKGKQRKDRMKSDDPAMAHRWQHMHPPWTPQYRMMPPHGYSQHCEADDFNYRRKLANEEVLQAVEKGKKRKQEEEKRFNEGKSHSEGGFSKEEGEKGKDREDSDKELKPSEPDYKQPQYSQDGHKNLPPRLQKHHMDMRQQQQQPFMRPQGSPYEPPWSNMMPFMGGMPVGSAGMPPQRRPRTGSEESEGHHYGQYDRPPSAGSSSDRYWPPRDAQQQEWNRRPAYYKQSSSEEVRNRTSSGTEKDAERESTPSVESEEQAPQVQKDPFEDPISSARSQTTAEREQPRPQRQDSKNKEEKKPKEKPKPVERETPLTEEVETAPPPSAWKSEGLTHSCWADAEDDLPSERSRDYKPVSLLDSKPKQKTDSMSQRNRISAPAPITRERLEAAEQQEKKFSNLTPLKSLGKKESHPPPPAPTVLETERSTPIETSWDQKPLLPETEKQEEKKEKEDPKETKNAWRIPNDQPKQDSRSVSLEPELKLEETKKPRPAEESPKDDKHSGSNEKQSRNKDYRSRGRGERGRGGQRGNNSYQVYNRGGRHRGGSLGKGEFRKRPARVPSDENMWNLGKWNPQSWGEYMPPPNEPLMGHEKKEGRSKSRDSRRGYDRNSFRGEPRGGRSWRGPRSSRGGARRAEGPAPYSYGPKPQMDGHFHPDRPRNRGEKGHGLEDEFGGRGLEPPKEPEGEMAFGGEYRKGGSGKPQKPRRPDRVMPPRFQRKQHEGDSDGRGGRQQRKPKSESRKSPENSSGSSSAQLAKQDTGNDPEDWETDSESSEVAMRPDNKGNKKSFSGQRPGGDRSNRRNPGSGGWGAGGGGTRNGQQQLQQQQHGQGKLGNQERRGGSGARNNKNGSKNHPKAEDGVEEATKSKTNALQGIDLNDVVGVVIVDNITDVTEGEVTSTDDGFQPVLSKRHAKEKRQNDDIAAPRNTPTPPPATQQKDGRRPRKDDKKSKNNKASFDSNRRAQKLPPRFAKQKENNKGSFRPSPENKPPVSSASVGVFSVKEVPPPPGNAWEKPISSMLRDDSQNTPHHNVELADKSQLDGSTPPVQTIIFENTNLKSPGTDSAAFQSDINKNKFNAQPKPQRPEKPRERKEKLEIEQPKMESGFTPKETTQQRDGEPPRTSPQPPIQLPFPFKSEDNNLAFTLPTLSDPEEKGPSSNKGPVNFPRAISSHSPSSPSTAELELKIGSCKKVWDMPTVMEQPPSSAAEHSDTNSPMQEADECNANFNSGNTIQGPVNVVKGGVVPPNTTTECPSTLTGPPSSSNVCKVKPQQVVSQMVPSPPPMMGMSSHTTPQHGPVGYQVSNTFSDGYRSNPLEMIRGDHGSLGPGGSLGPAGLSVNSNQPGAPAAPVGFQPMLGNTATAGPQFSSLSAVPSPPMMYNSSQQVVTQPQLYQQYQFESTPQMLTAGVGPGGRASQFNTPQYPPQAGYVGLSQQTTPAFNQSVYLQTPQAATPAAAPPQPLPIAPTDLYRMNAAFAQQQPNTSQNTMLASSSCKSSMQQSSVKAPHSNSQQVIIGPYDLISIPPSRYIQATQTHQGPPPPTGPPPYNQHSAAINIPNMQLQPLNLGQNAYGRHPAALMGKQADTLRNTNQIPSPGPHEQMNTYLQGYSTTSTTVGGMDKLRKAGGFNRMAPARPPGGRQMMMVSRPPGPSPLQHVNAHTFSNAPRFHKPQTHSFFTAAQPGGRDRGTPPDGEENKSEPKAEDVNQDGSDDTVLTAQ